MALTKNNLLPTDFRAPSFSLPDVVSGKQLHLNDLKGNKATVLMFICNHCPYVQHLEQGIIALANDYLSQQVGFVAISSNDVVRYPADGPEEMREKALRLSYPFPYLYDETQEVAKAYHAVCTPEFYLFDAQNYCIYHGQFDDARPGKHLPVTGKTLRSALDAFLNDQPIPSPQLPSMGCSIKWKN
ncbi:MAG: thioredoxin family protein [Thermonemataceae bacterium]